MVIFPTPSSNTSEPPKGRKDVSRSAKTDSLSWRLAGIVAMVMLLTSQSNVPYAGTSAGVAFAAHRAPLTGQLLVARDELRDPRFFHSVVYVVHHDAGGAMGLIVNRPMGKAPLSELLEQAGLEGTGVTGEIRVHFGGPVEPQRGFVLHTADYKSEGTEVVGNGIAVTVRAEILRAIGDGTGPRRSLFALGYAGWASGQLEAEIEAGAWEIVSADEALLFDDNTDTKWERGMARRTIYL